jgi:hypothetical protein
MAFACLVILQLASLGWFLMRRHATTAIQAST